MSYYSTHRVKRLAAVFSPASIARVPKVNESSDTAHVVYLPVDPFSSLEKDLFC